MVEYTLTNSVFTVPDLPEGTRYFRTGSSVICNPAVTDTDLDVVVVYSEELYLHLTLNGWMNCYNGEMGVEYPNTKVFYALRKGPYNIIMVSDWDAYARWAKFTEVARFMNLKEKSQRVALGSFIIEGNIREIGINY